MNSLLENIYLVSSIAGILMGLVMIAQLFKGKKADWRFLSGVRQKNHVSLEVVHA